MTDPIAKFKEWLEEAKRCQAIAEPTAMTLATTGLRNQPGARIVLLKDVGPRGFVFYTNLNSTKSTDLKHNPKAALCFYWMPLDKQVRVQGMVAAVSDEEADAYFATRAREKQIGAWASKQSQPLPNREALQKAVAEYEKQFAGQPVPRPPFWSGWRIVPEKIEFWQQGEARLHDRELYTRKGDRWEITKLYP